jgi:aryl-alcohol dehydrogenase-like predicted oxidoreductase
MTLRTLGQSSVQITPVLIGTWQAGKRWWVGIEDDLVIQAIREGVEAGITTIDTAEVYGDGYSERIVAKAVADQRDRLVYATKVFATHMKYDQVIEACERSLQNLQTDYIDLYQIHWPSGSFNTELVPIAETMRAMNTLKEQGKIRAIGVSNFSRSQLEEAAQYGQIDSLQPPYSLFWRQIEQDAFPYCVEKGMTVLAYSPLAQGLLTGKFGVDHRFPEGDVRRQNKLFQGENYIRAQAALEQLRPIADQYHCTLGQLSLAWLLAQPQTCAIAGISRPGQAADNAKAMEIRLSPETLAEMDRISRTVTDHLDKNPVMWKF